MEFPKLRELEAFPIAVSGQRMIGLRDPLKLTPEIIAVPPQLHLLLSLLDGQHSIVDIQAEYMRATGELLFSETIEDTLKKLDSALFLDNIRFQQKHSEIVDAFKQAGARPAMLAGKSYEDAPEALAGQIDSFFIHPEGPGIPGERQGDGLRAIIAPHIDFQRGGPCFAWAYKEVAEQADADVFVIFGTAHMRTTAPYVTTAKDFDTPFGTMPCAREIVEGIEKKVGFDLRADEFVHRGEHSIEFQTVFLRYLYRERNDITIVPILCGSFHEMIASGKRPIDDPRVAAFVAAVREALAESGKRVCYIAGADLAHVGPRFGDKKAVSDSVLKLLEADDLGMLDKVTSADAEGFFEYIRAEGDRRKICGLPPIYTMLKVADATAGTLLKYDQWPDPAGTVTFASVAFS